MIVKIIRGSEIQWRHCKSALWVPSDVEKDPKLINANLAIDMITDERIVESIECVHPNAVYFMSDSGQTIDSMRW